MKITIQRKNSENPLDYEAKSKEFGKNQEKIIEQKDSIASGAQFKNSENQNSRVVKITNQEFSKSQFKNDENHNSEVVKTIFWSSQNHNQIRLI